MRFSFVINAIYRLNIHIYQLNVACEKLNLRKSNIVQPNIIIYVLQTLCSVNRSRAHQLYRGLGASFTHDEERLCLILRNAWLKTINRPSNYVLKWMLHILPSIHVKHGLGRWWSKMSILEQFEVGRGEGQFLKFEISGRPPVSEAYQYRGTLRAFSWF